jgi:hypothetical protein
MKSIGKPDIPLPKAARLLGTDRKSHRRFPKILRSVISYWLPSGNFAAAKS